MKVTASQFYHIAQIILDRNNIQINGVLTWFYEILKYLLKIG